MVCTGLQLRFHTGDTLSISLCAILGYPPFQTQTDTSAYLVNSNSIVTVELELYICKINPCSLTEFEINLIR